MFPDCFHQLERVKACVESEHAETRASTLVQIVADLHALQALWQSGSLHCTANVYRNGDFNRRFP